MSEQSIAVAKKIYDARTPWVDCPVLTESLGDKFMVRIQPIDLRAQANDPDILSLMMGGSSQQDSNVKEQMLSNLKADGWIDDIICHGVIDPSIVNIAAMDVDADKGEIHVSALRGDRQAIFQAILDLSGYGGGSATGGATFREECDRNGAGSGSETIPSPSVDTAQPVG